MAVAGRNSGAKLVFWKWRLVVSDPDRCTTCGMALDDDGSCADCYVSPEERKRNHAMERGDYLRDQAKDEAAERKWHEDRGK